MAGSWPRTGSCSGEGLKDAMESWNILDLGLMRVLASSTLYIEGPIFPTRFSKELGKTFMGRKLSLFRLYVEKQDVLVGISCPIIWLGTILSCDSLGRGVGCFVGLYVAGVDLRRKVDPCLMLSLNGGLL